MLNFIFILLGIILVGIAGIAEAVMDKLIFHYEISIFEKLKNKKYWNPKISWENKYKEDLKTPKFIGSTTIFVFLTDAWHFFKFIRTLLLFIGLIIIGFNTSVLILCFSYGILIDILLVLVFPIIARIVFGLLFQYFFKKIFTK